MLQKFEHLKHREQSLLRTGNQASTRLPGRVTSNASAVLISSDTRQASSCTPLPSDLSVIQSHASDDTSSRNLGQSGSSAALADATAQAGRAALASVAAALSGARQFCLTQCFREGGIPDSGERLHSIKRVQTEKDLATVSASHLISGEFHTFKDSCWRNFQHAARSAVRVPAITGRAVLLRLAAAVTGTARKGRHLFGSAASGMNEWQNKGRTCLSAVWARKPTLRLRPGEYADKCVGMCGKFLRRSGASVCSIISQVRRRRCLRNPA